jgi:carbamoyltransferase
MNILGVSCFYHDAAAALLQDGRLIAAAEEERFSRIKHDSGLPERSIAFCLARGGITAAELDYVVFYEKPLLKFERILLSGLRTYPRAWRSFGEATISWLGEKLWVRELLRESLGVPRERILFAEHHEAHAASALFCSPFEEAAILTIDGVGEWTTTAIGHGTADWGDGGRANEIRLSHELHFPHSLGLLYSAFTAWLGFEVNEGEYKVMGMAPYGTPRHVDRVLQLLEIAEDGSFWLDLRYFSFHHSADRSFSARFLDLFGPPRDPAAHFAVDGSEAGRDDGELLRRNAYYADVAASVQAVTEEIVLRIARRLRRETGSPNLCLAGGVALNSVANGRLARESGFADIFIQPAAGDAGGAVGAALHVWHVVLGRPRSYVMEHAYLGEDYDADGFALSLAAQGVRTERFSNEDALVARTVAALAAGGVVGVARGRFEWGPRALGNRSILADPRHEAMKARVNEKIKFREPFRPFAPAILAEAAGEYFDAPAAVLAQYPARFMQYVLPFDADAGLRAPAVNHCGTGRLQVVRPEWNPLYHEVIAGFHQETGVPLLLNTSFNLRGEPIVASPEDAWRTFRNSGLDLLVLGEHIITKDAAHALASAIPSGHGTHSR